MDADEWPAILAECDPDYTPPDGQPHGLRNLHVFALANVLRRPLLLLDSLSGLRSSGDYAGTPPVDAHVHLCRVTSITTTGDASKTVAD